VGAFSLDIHRQSLDNNKSVQVDSRDGLDGVTPTHKVPVTLENMLRSASGVDVEVEFALEIITGNKTPGNDG
jgi:carboxyl-terminal processing protease